MMNSINFGYYDAVVFHIEKKEKIFENISIYENGILDINGIDQKDFDFNTLVNNYNQTINAICKEKKEKGIRLCFSVTSSLIVDILQDNFLIPTLAVSDCYEEFFLIFIDIEDKDYLFDKVDLIRFLLLNKIPLNCETLLTKDLYDELLLLVSNEVDIKLKHKYKVPSKRLNVNNIYLKELNLINPSKQIELREFLSNNFFCDIADVNDFSNFQKYIFKKKIIYIIYRIFKPLFENIQIEFQNLENIFNEQNLHFNLILNDKNKLFTVDLVSKYLMNYGVFLCRYDIENHIYFNQKGEKEDVIDNINNFPFVEFDKYKNPFYIVMVRLMDSNLNDNVYSKLSDTSDDSISYMSELLIKAFNTS